MKPKATVRLWSEQSPEPLPSFLGKVFSTVWTLSIEGVVIGQEDERRRWCEDRDKYTRIEYAPGNLVDLFNQLCEKFDPPDASPAGVGVETTPPQQNVMAGSETAHLVDCLYDLAKNSDDDRTARMLRKAGQVIAGQIKPAPRHEAPHGTT